MDISGNSSQGPRSILDVIENGFNFRWSDYFSSGFRAFGNDFGIYVAFTLVYIAISMATGFIPYVGTTIGLFVNPVLIAGYIYYGRAQYVNDHRDFNTFFQGFRQPQWIPLVVQSLMASFLLVVAIAGATIPFFYESILKFLEDAQKIETLPQAEVGEFVLGLWNTDLTIASIIALVVGLMVSTLICLAPFFIIYRSSSFGEAMQSSARVVRKRFPAFLGLMMMLWLVLILGVLLCCIGFLAAFPIYHLVLLAAFRDIMGEDQGPSHAANPSWPG